MRRRNFEVYFEINKERGRDIKKLAISPLIIITNNIITTIQSFTTILSSAGYIWIVGKNTNIKIPTGINIVSKKDNTKHFFSHPIFISFINFRLIPPS